MSWKLLRLLRSGVLLPGLLSLLAAGCSGDVGGGGSAVDSGSGSGGADAIAREGGQAGGAGFTPVQVHISAEPTTGNAPLTVQFRAEVRGIAVERVVIEWDFGNGATSSQQDPLFTFYKPGDTTVKLQVFEKGNPSNVARDSLVIRSSEPADLVASEITITSGTELPPGGRLEVSLVVDSKGGGVDRKVPVAVFLSKDEVLKPAIDREVGRVDAGPFAAGKPYRIDDLAIDLPEDLPEAAYFVFLLVDPDQDLDELDETNNRALAPDFISVTEEAATQPDLVVAKLTFGGGLVLSAGETLSYSLEVANEGDGEATNFRFAIYLSTDTVWDPNDQEITDPSSTKIFSQKPGARLPIFRGYGIPQELAEGHYYLVARVDPNGAVAERDEGNNEAVSPHTFEVKRKEITGKDLELVQIRLPTRNSYWTGSVKLDLRIRNAGTELVTGAKATAYFTEDKSINPNVDFVLQAFDLPDIPAGEEVDLTRVLKVSDTVPLREYFVGVILDPAKKIPELDETNNFGVSEHKVLISETATVDLLAKSVEFHPLAVAAGETITVAYTVENEGSSGSGAFEVWIVLSDDDKISAAEAKNGTDAVVFGSAVADLTGGESAEVVEKVTIPVALPYDKTTYYLGVIVDPEKTTGKGNKGAEKVLVAADQLQVTGAQGGCKEDGQEPNDAAFEAVDIQPGSMSAALCDGGDYYRVEVPAGHSLRLSVASEAPLSLTPVDPDLDLVILGPDGAVLARGDQKGKLDTAAIFAVPATAFYVVGVLPRVAGNQGAYDLQVDVVPPQAGVDLLVSEVEALPNMTFPGGLISVKVTVVNLGDQDAGPFETALYLSQDALLDDGDAKLADVAVSDAFSASSVIFEQNVVLPVLPGGSYRILARADAQEAIAETDEGNNLAFSGQVVLNGDLACVDDALEPNNAPAIATHLEAVTGLLSDLVVCPALEDWYSVDLKEGKAFLAQVSYATDSTRGAIHVQLFAPDADSIVDASTKADNPVVGLPFVFLPGTYYLRVFHAGVAKEPGPFTYNLGINITEPFEGDVCAPDLYEPNWGPADASVIGCGLQRLTLCKKDRDGFKIDVAADQTVSLTLDHPEAALRLRVFADPNANPIKQLSGNGTLTVQLTHAQTLYLEVTAKTPSTSPGTFDYTLFVDGVSGRDLVVGDVTPFPESVVQGEDAFLEYSVENRCIDPVASFDVGFYLSEDDIWDPGDIPLGAETVGDGVGGKSVHEAARKITFPQNAPVGPVRVLVVADPFDLVEESNESNNVGGAPVEILELCVDDAKEPNNAPAQAVEVSPGVLTGLALCPADRDWYAFTTTAGRVVDLQLQFTHADGDLDLRLYHESSFVTPVASSLSKDDDEIISWVTKKSGTYYLRVNGFAGASNTYDLTVSY